MAIRVYNTLRNKKEEFVPVEEGKVKMYVCGPTTYNYIHLGNARPIVAFDVVRRYFTYRGYDVTYIQNFTDVDDKIINRANEEGMDPKDLANKYIEAYFEDAGRLGVQKPGGEALGNAAEQGAAERNGQRQNTEPLQLLRPGEGEGRFGPQLVFEIAFRELCQHRFPGADEDPAAERGCDAFRGAAIFVGDQPVQADITELEYRVASKAQADQPRDAAAEADDGQDERDLAENTSETRKLLDGFQGSHWDPPSGNL